MTAKKLRYLNFLINLKYPVYLVFEMLLMLFCNNIFNWWTGCQFYSHITHKSD